MFFNSLLFMFIFLPAAFVLVSLTPTRFKTTTLLGLSIFFYAWSEGSFTGVLLLLTAANYLLGLALEGSPSPRRKRNLLAAGILMNIGMLAAFKYAGFLHENVNAVLEWIHARPLSPLSSRFQFHVGVSFVTFLLISYLVDVSRGAGAIHDPLRMASYTLFFPRLPAGPIVRYAQSLDQIDPRAVHAQEMAEGIRRFTQGLAKKVLIADTLSLPCFYLFSISADSLTPGLAWWGALCYFVQIYFDFSGYTDMAIGLGCLFGFRLPENFNFPYASQSVMEFWRRWHISLTNWLREYLYFPISLKLNRQFISGKQWGMMAADCLATMIVFSLCGLWHGASWNFLAWGAYHGIFLSFERMGLKKILDSCGRIFRHAYLLLVIMAGWVLFRLNNISRAIGWWKTMLFLKNGTGVDPYYWRCCVNAEALTAAGAGLFLAFPIFQSLRSFAQRSAADRTNCAPSKQPWMIWGGNAAYVLLLGLSVTRIVGGNFHPFIYFKF